MTVRRRTLVAAVVVALVAGGCSAAPDAAGLATGGTVPSPPPTPSPTPAEPPQEDPVGFDRGTVALPRGTQVQPAPTTPPVPSEPAEPAPSTAPAEPAPTVDDTHPVALTWDGIDLRLPSARTELVGFHQSNHDGARDLQAYDGVVPVVVMETRERGTGPRGASDIVVHPGTELRAPVTGTVRRAGTYTLYCDEVDDFLVIEPDGRPGIEVKLLHIDGVQVVAGERVEAGVTVVAPRPTQLPFASQVDELSGPDDWPHVHLELVDTAIPDIPNGNSGSDDC